MAEYQPKGKPGQNQWWDFADVFDDPAVEGDVRSVPKRNSRGKKTGTTYQQWNGKKWETVDKEKYEDEKQKPSIGQKLPTTSAAETVPASPYRPRNIPKTPKKEEFGNLRYPQDLIDKSQDFIKFEVFNYKKNRSTVTREDSNLIEKSLGTVILPIPSQLNDQNAVDYQGSGLNFMQEEGIDAVKNVIGSGGIGEFFGNTSEGIQQAFDRASGQTQLINNFIAKTAVNSIGGNVTTDQLTARSTGQIINPNMELLFNGPVLREFTFTFKFTPRFKKESDVVRDIIKVFKRNMRPKGSGGDFLTTPNVFRIKYMEGSSGKDHKFLNKFKICALKSASVNYTADGVYATYHDGTPISMELQLEFGELTPIYNEDYDEYGNDTGVGF